MPGLVGFGDHQVNVIIEEGANFTGNTATSYKDIYSYRSCSNDVVLNIQYKNATYDGVKGNAYTNLN